VVSAAEGVVHLAGWRSDYGNMVILDHGYGLTTWYAHLANIFVDSGQLIKKGQLIGTVGSTGRATGPHLHYEIRQADRPLNPLMFILGPGQTQ
jgi:murein DD-endopeptidase MepM/ murein hydrolase activator NlpD